MEVEFRVPVHVSDIGGAVTSSLASPCQGIQRASKLVTGQCACTSGTRTLWGLFVSFYRLTSCSFARMSALYRKSRALQRAGHGWCRSGLMQEVGWCVLSHACSLSLGVGSLSFAPIRRSAQKEEDVRLSLGRHPSRLP